MSSSAATCPSATTLRRPWRSARPCSRVTRSSRWALTRSLGPSSPAFSWPSHAGDSAAARVATRRSRPPPSSASTASGPVPPWRLAAAPAAAAARTSLPCSCGGSCRRPSRRACRCWQSSTLRRRARARSQAAKTSRSLPMSFPRRSRVSTTGSRSRRSGWPTPSRRRRATPRSPAAHTARPPGRPRRRLCRTRCRCGRWPRQRSHGDQRGRSALGATALVGGNRTLQEYEPPPLAFRGAAQARPQGPAAERRGLASECVAHGGQGTQRIAPLGLSPARERHR
mmetsp:Transcript_41911/g.126915  ORF Transcript_41911/g.126915 Transcript_41911/m.126915 type:complete len:283 (-) Transcript_41911:102-950(-)